MKAFKPLLVWVLCVGCYILGKSDKALAHRCEKATEAACILSDIVRLSLDHMDNEFFEEIVDDFLPQDSTLFATMGFRQLKSRQDALDYCWCY